MFFLGASANILVYLLVSAFFVVCVYFNGDLENRKIDSTFRITTIYSPEKTDFSFHETYYFSLDEVWVKQDKSSIIKVCDTYPVFFPASSSDTYTTPDLSGLSLRAPPCLPTNFI